MATQAQRTFATRIDIPEASREKLVEPALGGLALGTARMAASASTLDEYPLGAVAGMDTVEAIADRLSAYGASVRMAIEAASSSRTRTQPISSSRSRARSTSTSGSSRRTCRPRARSQT
jgi:DNA-binding ferritin-like protein